MFDIMIIDNKCVNFEYLVIDLRKLKFRCMVWFLDYMLLISIRNSLYRVVNSLILK